MDRIKVFIVEDDIITANDMAQQLETEGCEITAIAGDAVKALEIIGRSRPDIALLDIGLGKNKMDGIELARRIREIHDLPIIFLTAYADQDTIKRAMETAPSSYLVKPINSRQLMVSVNLAMSRFALKKTEMEHTSTPEGKIIEKDYFIFNDSLFIRIKERFCKTSLSNMLWIEADGNYTTVVTMKNKYVIITSLGSFISQLGKTAPYIVRTHRSYAVNINQVDSFNLINVFIKGTEIPLSKNYRDDFFRLIGYK